MPDRRAILSASEIGQFAYCRRAWWLARVLGREPSDLEALAAGERRHRRHGRTLRAARLGQKAAYLLIAAGVLAGLVWLLVTLWAGGGS